MRWVYSVDYVHVDSSRQLLHTQQQQSIKWWLLVIEALLACSEQHRLSKHTQLYLHDDQLVIVDPQSNGRDESMFLANSILKQVPHEVSTQHVVNDTESIKDCMMTLQELYKHLSGKEAPRVYQPTYLISQLYTLNQDKVFQMFKKVVGSSNFQLENDIKRGVDDVNVLGQLQVAFKERENNDSTDHHRLRMRLEQLDGLVRLRGVTRLLDFGGGNGDLAHALRTMCSHGCKAYCLDIKRWISKEHTLKYQDVNYAFVDTWRLPYEDASFDLITVMQVVHHLDHPRQTLQELSRVLVSGGRLVIREHDCRSLEDKLCIDLEHFIYEVRFRNNPCMCCTYEAQYYSREVLYEMLEEVGLKLVTDKSSSTVSRCYNSVWRKL
jgi:ubiquinone/menaquinone biosynthesis C-methylase UbiE